MTARCSLVLHIRTSNLSPSISLTLMIKPRVKEKGWKYLSHIQQQAAWNEVIMPFCIHITLDASVKQSIFFSPASNTASGNRKARFGLSQVLAKPSAWNWSPYDVPQLMSVESYPFWTEMPRPRIGFVETMIVVTVVAGCHEYLGCNTAIGIPLTHSGYWRVETRRLHRGLSESNLKALLAKRCLVRHRRDRGLVVKVEATRQK